MFAIEIGFPDSPSAPEMLFVRRHFLTIGSEDKNHVVVDDLSQSNATVKLTRTVERKFRCEVSYPGKEPESAVYDGSAAITVGDVSFFLVALDIDLLPKDSESPDKAGVRLIRSATGKIAPHFPAIVVPQNPSIVVSFHEGQSIDVGRGRQASLRLDNSDISALHARIGFENGMFWVEDLGSTNGTFVGNSQISGRVNVEPGATIQLGSDTVVIGVSSAEELKELGGSGATEIEQRPPTLQRAAFPAILSLSDVARPARLLMIPGNIVKIGRDPSCDMWIGAPHISRVHCSMQLQEDGVVIIRDQSTNGTSVDGKILRKGDYLECRGEPKVLELGGGVTIALCFSVEDEQRFSAVGGSGEAFSRVAANQELPASQEGGNESTISSPVKPGSKTLLAVLGVTAIAVVGVIVLLVVPLIFN